MWAQPSALDSLDGPTGKATDVYNKLLALGVKTPARLKEVTDLSTSNEQAKPLELKC